ncbi:MAG: c-type cytochrome biogenesis protein CcmI [Burkholderiales bacterium]|nr:c-type cytochrome biogenesis protein CcmI [Burkholderiales bacterium]
MTTIAFWLIALLLSGVALLFVVLPLLRGARPSTSTTQSQLNVEVHRDRLTELNADLRAGNLSSEQYAQARDELKRCLIEDVPQQSSGSNAVRFNDRRVAIMLAAIIPLASIVLYALLGNQQGLAPGSTPGLPPGPIAQKPQQQFTPEQVVEMVERLAARLEQSPQDAQGWALLGRAYYSMRRYSDAERAFAKAAALTPNDAQVLVDYADALAIDAGQGLVGKPMELIAKALKLDPDNPKALTLAGSAAFDSQDYPVAVAHWDKLLRTLPPESEFSRDISASIAKAQQLAALSQGKKKAAPAPRKGEAQSAAASSEANTPVIEPGKPEVDAGPGGVAGTVSLSTVLADRVEPTDTVFIFARAQNKKAPLAVIRKQVKDLPASFALTDASALLPELKISNYKQVIIGARISRTGTATAKKGDLEGFSNPVKVGSKNVDVTISTPVR